MSSSADEPRAKVIRMGGHVYRWEGDLHEFAAIEVDGDRWVTLHSLVSQTNGAILDVLAEEGW